MLVGAMMVVSGFSLGDTADELITWVAQYDDDTKTEGDDKNDSSADDPDGTSAQQDIILHLVTAFYGYTVISAISLGAYIFAWNFLDIRNGGADLQCEVKVRDYSAFSSAAAGITDYASCIEAMPAVMAAIDLNGDGMLDRCEDVNLQVNIGGSTLQYATKFAGGYTLAYAKKAICGEFAF